MCVDLDELLDLAERFDVMSLPTVLIVRGGVEVARLDGLIREDDVLDVLEDQLGVSSAAGAAMAPAPMARPELRPLGGGASGAAGRRHLVAEQASCNAQALGHRQIRRPGVGELIDEQRPKVVVAERAGRTSHTGATFDVTPLTPDRRGRRWHPRARHARRSATARGLAHPHVGPGRACLYCIGALLRSDVELDREGLLDDPDYLRGLTEQDRERYNRRNVFPFSLAVAVHAVFQAVSLVAGSPRIAGVGPQHYAAYPGEMTVTPTAKCQDDCEMAPLTASAIGLTALLPRGEEP